MLWTDPLREAGINRGFWVMATDAERGPKGQTVLVPHTPEKLSLLESHMDAV